jgi:putative nucleotidyltransferase with HDIG domain
MWSPNPVRSISGKVFLSFLLLLLFSFSGLYFTVTEAFKNQLGEEFSARTNSESELLILTSGIPINNLDYLTLYEIMKAFLKSDPDVTEIVFYEYSPEVVLSKVSKGNHSHAGCEKDIFEKPCYILYKEKIPISSFQDINVEIRYSTTRIIRKLSKVKRTILFIELSIFLIVLLVLNLSYSIVKKRIDFIVNSIRNWRNGGLKNFELDTAEDEFKVIEKSVSEMYFEILKEREIDEILLNLTSKIVLLITQAPDFRDFCRKLEKVLKTELRLNYVKISTEGNFVKVHPGQKVFHLKNNPEIKIIVEGSYPFSEKILSIFGNLIDAALLSAKEKSNRESLFINTITAFANVIDATSSWTKGHSERVSKIAVEIGEILGLNNNKLKLLKIGGLLHDIGKLGIPQTIINKPENLTEEEYEIVRKHPEIGYRILKPIEELKEVLLIILYHHERCNGSGYPEGLKCDEIPGLAKIVAVADVIEAMTTERPYKKALTLEETLEYLKANAGRDKLFDEEIVKAACAADYDIRRIIENRRAKTPLFKAGIQPDTPKGC